MLAKEEKLDSLKTDILMLNEDEEENCDKKTVKTESAEKQEEILVKREKLDSFRTDDLMLKKNKDENLEEKAIKIESAKVLENSLHEDDGEYSNYKKKKDERKSNSSKSVNLIISENINIININIINIDQYYK